MSIIIPANSAVGGGFNVANSLRFNRGSSDSLSFTPDSTTNRRTFTISFWTKISEANVGSVEYGIFNAGQQPNDNGWFNIQQGHTSDGDFMSQFYSGAFRNFKLTQKISDTNAWYHFVVAMDTTQGTDTNRLKYYINGTQVTSFNSPIYPDQNFDTKVSTDGQIQSIGSKRNGSAALVDHFEGYLSEFVMIDGQQLAPDQFGEFDEDSGIWKPIDVSGLTFGTNGFYLDFEDSSALGNDAAGSNNFTVNNLTAIDQMVDTPTNNYATFNPLIVGEPTATFLGYAEGNLQGSSAGGVSANTILLPTSGKWFVEYHFNNASASSDPGVGFWSIDTSQSHRWYQSSFKGLAWKYNDDVYLNGSNSFTAATFTSGDIISIAVDMDNNRVTFYKNGSAVNNLTNYSFDFTVSLGNFTVGIVDGRTASAGDANFDMNAGQNGTFNGRKTAGGNSDGDGYGNFSMSVPSGYYALNTKNLAEYG